ncbi:MAG: ABC transporter permease [Deltaproteobacteria bacterium]|nr:ABC transporter permease [Deltaproteobacteria bacterium]
MSLSETTLSPVRHTVRDLELLGARSLHALACLLLLRLRRAAWIRQAFEAGNRSLVFVAATMGFIGMIMVLQSGYQAARLIGDYSLIGPAFLQLLVREFAPTIGALMITTRVGAGIAAEIGSMAVTEQLDALRMSGADPVEELMVPRLLAGLLMVPALTVIGGASAELAGLVTARVAFEVPYATFFSVRMVDAGDIVVGLVKALTFGAVIPLLSAHAGMQARRGSEGVGAATTRAVIHTSVAIIFLDFTINVLLYPLYAR